MTNMYVTQISKRKTSQNKDTGFYTVEMIDDNLNVYYTYVCDKYRNYRFWKEIITRGMLSTDILHVTGNWRFKDLKTIDADSVPKLQNSFEREGAMQVFYERMQCQ